jgi:RNA polymerase sigma-70 factor (ECF subfamily)
MWRKLLPGNVQRLVKARGFHALSFSCARLPQFGNYASDVSSQPESRAGKVIALPRSLVTDAELVSAVARGDEQALSQVWERYVADVRLSIRSSLGPDPAIDDLVQEVFLAFFRNASRMQNPRALRAYLLGTALRQAAFEIRTRRRRFRWLRLTSTGTLPEASTESPVESRDALAVLRQVLHRVPELPRMAFELRYVMDLSPPQVALSLNVSEAKARRAITEARERVLELAKREPSLAPYIRALPEDRQ